MTTTMGPGTLRHRLLVVAAALAVFASLVAISAPVASASIDISIPIDTIVRAQFGSETLLATVDSSEFAGLECTVSAVSTNQDSTHPNNDLIVASDGTSVVLEDVEAVPGATINADGVLLMGDTVTVTLLMGEDRRFSAGITVNIDCEEVLQAEVSINPNACVVNEQGVPLGSVDVVITPDSGATVTLYSDAAMQNLVGTFTGAGGSQDLSPGTYYWAAEAGTGYELAGDTSGSFTIEDCEPPLEPETDLEVTKVDLVDPVVVSTDSPTALITYEVTVSNNGPELAESVVVTDTLPATLTYVSSSPAVGTCAHAAGVVTCELGDLAVGGSVKITIVVETEAVGEITDTSPLNVVEVSSDTEEVNLENNVDSEETDIVEVLDLVVLPFTGINTPFMLTGAIMLLGAGLTLVLVSRRREFEI